MNRIPEKPQKKEYEAANFKIKKQQKLEPNTKKHSTLIFAPRTETRRSQWPQIKTTNEAMAASPSAITPLKQSRFVPERLKKDLFPFLLQEERFLQKFTPFEIALLIFSILGQLILAPAIKDSLNYGNEFSYVENAIRIFMILFAIGGLPMSIVTIILQSQDKLTNKTMLLKNPLFYVMFIILTAGLSLITSSYFERLPGVSFGILALYFASAALIEEMFFRWFIVGGGITLLSGKIPETNSEKIKRTIIAILLVLGSAVAFGYAHAGIYDLNGVWAMIGAGLIFGIFYIWTGDWTVAAFGHALMNIIILAWEVGIFLPS